MFSVILREESGNFVKLLLIMNFDAITLGISFNQSQVGIPILLPRDHPFQPELRHLR